MPMDDDFRLPVNYGGKELEFPARLFHYGYIIKLEVEVEGLQVFFERDEERNWRAILSYEDAQANKSIDRELLKAITDSIEEITK
jgi:hypothetical protein